jgi:hypothetical protein
MACYGDSFTFFIRWHTLLFVVTTKISKIKTDTAVLIQKPSGYVVELQWYRTAVKRTPPMTADTISHAEEHGTFPFQESVWLRTIEMDNFRNFLLSLKGNSGTPSWKISRSTSKIFIYSPFGGCQPYCNMFRKQCFWGSVPGTMNMEHRW